MLRNITIRKKLIMAFSVLIALMVVIFTIAFVRFGQMDSRVDEITEVTAKKVLLIGQIKHDITAVSRDQKNMIATVEDEKMIEIGRSIEKTFKSINENVENAMMPCANIKILSTGASPRNDVMVSDVPKVPVKNSMHIRSKPITASTIKMRNAKSLRTNEERSVAPGTKVSSERVPVSPIRGM